METETICNLAIVLGTLAGIMFAVSRWMWKTRAEKAENNSIKCETLLRLLETSRPYVPDGSYAVIAVAQAPRLEGFVVIQLHSNLRMRYFCYAPNFGPNSSLVVRSGGFYK